MWKTPLCGDGIEASSRLVTGATFCPAVSKPAWSNHVQRNDPAPAGPFLVGARLEQDLERDRDRAALPDQIGREMEVDIVACRQPSGVAHGVADALELFRTPLFDPLELRVQR